MASLKLSVLDQSPVSAGSTPGEALQNTIDLARVADELGFHRYWIAEHHAMDVLASPGARGVAGAGWRRDLADSVGVGRHYAAPLFRV